MSWTRKALLLAALVVPAACSDAPMSPTGGPEIAGRYSLVPGRGEFFFINTDGKTYDLAKEGSQVTVDISPNGTIKSHIFVPAEGPGAEDYQVDLNGTWAMQNNVIYFSHTNGEATVLSTIPFVVNGDMLVGERQYIDGYVKLTIVK